MLDRAVRLFCAEGVDGLSLNQICTRLGVSKPALYRAFGNEDGLKRAALARYFEAWMEPRLGRLDLSLAFADQCKALARLMAFSDPGSPAAEGCLLTRMRVSRAGLGPESLAITQTLEAGLLGKLVEWTSAVAASGQMKSGPSPIEAARYIDAQIKLALIDQSQGADPEGIEARLILALSALQR